FFSYKISDIKPSFIKFWLSSIDDVGSKSKKHYLNILNQIFKLALDDDLLSKNPCENIKIIYFKPKINPFNSFEVNQILEKSLNYNYKFQIFLKIGFYTGMRTGEILALKIKEIDLEKRIIYINSTRSRFGEGAPKTFYSIRKIPIFNILYTDLKNFVLSNKNNTYLFETQYNKPYRDDFVFCKFYKQILKDLSLSYRRPYTMRHTFATNFLLNSNLSPLELSKILGHSSPEMVYKVYVKYIDDLKDNFKRDIQIYKI
ncbi:site-specific integrase, partial [Campylobacter jejuni]|nr:site-specific integrase [Campylobacter jejuni]EAK2356995.1 site-specific integrase [Campylobacter jejuni]EAL6791960.1 site-specific integrase [Campylobacter jejuni]EIM2281809.1 site-specific integrase [Campylobacter jejuni]